MQIKDLALLELFLETICEASIETAGDERSGCDLAMQLESTGSIPTTLAEQLNASDSLLDALADRYESNGQTSFASVARILSSALANDQLLSSDEHESHRRLLDYVYPVV